MAKKRVPKIGSIFHKIPTHLPTYTQLTKGKPPKHNHTNIYTKSITKVMNHKVIHFL